MKPGEKNPSTNNNTDPTTGFDNLGTAVPFAGAQPSGETSDAVQSFNDRLADITKDLKYTSHREVAADTTLSSREMNLLQALPSTWIADTISAEDATTPEMAERTLAKAQRAVEVATLFDQDEKDYTPEEIQAISDRIVDFMDKNNIRNYFSPGSEFWETNDTSISTEDWAYWCRHYRDIPNWPKYQSLEKSRHQIDELDTMSEKPKEGVATAAEEQFDKIVKDQKANFVSKHPEIYSDIDAQGLGDACIPILDEIKKKDILNIEKLYKTDGLEKADAALIDYLSDKFDLKNTPSISYITPIVETISGEKEGELVTLGQFHESTNIIDLPSDYKAIGSTDRMATIAHELWHARQHEIASSDIERGRLYKMNFTHYIHSEDDFDGYRDQLVEKEARFVQEEIYRIVAPTLGTRIFDLFNTTIKFGRRKKPERSKSSGSATSVGAAANIVKKDRE